MNFEEIGLKAWENLQSSAVFQSEVPEAVFPVFEPIVKSIPGLLGKELLQSPATMTNIAKAKAIVVQHAIESNFISNYLKAAGLDSDMFGLLEGAMQAVAKILKDMIENSISLLEEAGVSEEAVLINMGLDEELTKKCQQGAMTIKELFVNYPYIIIKNTD